MPGVREWENDDGGMVPRGWEYYLPVSTGTFPGRFAAVRELNSSGIRTYFQPKWNTGHQCVDILGSCLSTYTPRSAYHLPSYTPGEPHYWILFEQHDKILFVPEPGEYLVMPGLHPDASLLLAAFAGYKFCITPPDGRDFLVGDMGFVGIDELNLIESTDESYLWESDPSVIGGAWIFSDSCGNRFLCRADGSVVKWMMGSCDILTVFDSIFEFTEELARFCSAEDARKYEGPL